MRECVGVCTLCFKKSPLCCRASTDYNLVEHRPMLITNGSVSVHNGEFMRLQSYT